MGNEHPLKWFLSCLEVEVDLPPACAESIDRRGFRHYCMKPKGHSGDHAWTAVKMEEFSGGKFRYRHETESRLRVEEADRG